MAEDDDKVVDFIGEQFRRLNLRFDTLDQRIATLDNKVDTRLANVERRLTAQTHFEQSMVAHLASIHSGIDNLRADFIGVEQRMKVLEAR